MNEPPDPGGHLLGAQPQMDRQVGFRDQTDPDRLPMDQTSIAPQRFQRMADGMSIVQDAPAIGFPFIRANNLRLDFARTRDRVHHRLRLQFQQIRHGGIYRRLESFVGDDAVFDDLG